MKINAIAITVGILLMFAGILSATLKPTAAIALPLALISIGGYLFAIGLSSIFLNKKYYSDKSPAAYARNGMIKKIQTIVYVVIGIIMFFTLTVSLLVL